MQPGQIDIGRRGLFIAACIFAAWAVTLVALCRIELTWSDALWIPVAMAVRSFLNVGLFITAHDAMHGTLCTYNAHLNHAVGKVAVFLYAGFRYEPLLEAHIAHHDAPGTEHDPDFADDVEDGFWHWFRSFMVRYFSMSQLLVMNVFFLVVWSFSTSVVNVFLFWAIPAGLSALQLFYFGTYQPHRVADDVFVDEHRTRSSDRSVFWSFLTCYHFGYHLEHHRYPWVPWWALPSARRIHLVDSTKWSTLSGWGEHSTHSPD